MMAETAGHGDDSRTICRQKNWASAMGGAYVMILRMDGSAPYNDKMTDCTTLRRFFESTNFDTMAPHDELGNSGTWVLADPGTSYIAYRTAAGSLVLSGLSSGTYNVHWLDPVSGAKVNSTVSITNTSHSFDRPGSFGNEAAVWIDRIGDAEKPAITTIAPVNHLLLKE